MVRVHEDEVDILCNECSALIRAVPVSDVESTMRTLGQFETICSVRCPHCGAVNSFPYFSSMLAFRCSECGSFVEVNSRIKERLSLAGLDAGASNSA